MNRISVFVLSSLLAACGVLSLAAQTPSPQTATPAVSPETHRKHRHDRPVSRPPASIVPSVQARVNTPQRMAALNNQPPLTQLPAFSARDRDGHLVSAKAVTHAKHWLLVYRRQDCLPCDRLMTVLASPDNPGLAGGLPYVIVVAGKDPEAMEKVRANYTSLNQATWLSDKDLQVFAALKPRGTPMLYAMDGHTIAWSIPGNLGDPAKVEKMAESWIANASASASTATATK